MHDDSDVALMLGLQKGDTAAFEILLRRHQEPILNLAYRFLGDRDEAEDLTQDVFLRLYRARASYRPDAKFTTWLYRIASNACLNALRARKGRRAMSLEGLAADGRNATPIQIEDTKASAPPVALLRDEMGERIRGIVDGLPDAQRLAIVLNKYQDLSYEEVAEAMDLTVMAVKSLLFRARERIKERLMPYLREEVR
ncbi:MAG: sigma-70 family RNA polymerase sigma factor [Planctomycetes bacterium]|nr:sigma-70 family RNA polymerase sigma factor [Planctomycetota bacterium]